MLFICSSDNCCNELRPRDRRQICPARCAVEEKRVCIKDGYIKRITGTTNGVMANKFIDLSEPAYIILPGFVDPHVHLRDDEESNKGTVLSETSKAAAGGYTTVVDMPNKVRPLVTYDRIDEFEAKAREAPIDVFIHGGVHKDHLEDIEEIAGHPLCRGFK